MLGEVENKFQGTTPKSVSLSQYFIGTLSWAAVVPMTLFIIAVEQG
jgi:hypothetical protein